MAHLLRTGNHIFKLGTKLFGVKDSYRFNTTNTISGFSSPNGIAIDIFNNRYYVANQNGNSVSVIDRDSLLIIHTITGLSAPQDVQYNIVDNTIIIANNVSLQILNAADYTTVSISPNFGDMWGVAVDNDLGRYYVSRRSNNTVNVYRKSDFSLVTILTGFDNPIGICFDPVSKRIFIPTYGSNNVQVYDAVTFAFITSISVPGPLGVSFDVMNDRLYISSYGAQSLYVVNGSSYGIVNVKLFNTSVWGAVSDFLKHRVLVVSQGFSQVIVETATLI